MNRRHHIALIWFVCALNTFLSCTRNIEDDSELPLQSGLSSIAITKAISMTDATIVELLEEWKGKTIVIKDTVTISLNVPFKMPAGYTTTLLFEGGCIVFGEASETINTNGNFIVDGAPYQIFYGNNIFVSDNGKPLKADVVYAEWYGAKADGVTYCAQLINDLIMMFEASKIQLLSGTYILENQVKSDIDIIGSSKTILKRCDVWIDIPITSTIPNMNPIVFTVDTTNLSFSKLKPGMGVSIYARSGTIGAGRFEKKYRTITKIEGDTITCYGGKPISIALESNGKNASLTNNFNLISVNGSKLSNVTIEGGRDIVPYKRIHWEHGVAVSCYGTKASIEDCIINNAVGDAIVCYGIDSYISRNLTLHSGSNACHLSGCYGATVSDNHFFDSNLNSRTGHNEGAISYSNQVANIVIDSNIFDTCLAGIGSINSADNCKSVITNNTFVNFKTHGIEGTSLSNYYGSVIQSFIIKGNRFCAKSNDNNSWEQDYQLSPLSERVDANGYGIYLKESTEVSWENISIMDNIFDDCGVYIGNCKNAIVSNNHFLYENTMPDDAPEYVVNLFDVYANISGNVFNTMTPLTSIINAVDGFINVNNNMYSKGYTLVNLKENIFSSNNVAF